jgi:hypothetical protein
VQKGLTQTNRRLKLGLKYKGAKKPSVPWSGAPDCPVCHRTVSGAPGPYSLKLATLRFLRAHSAIIHRTLRCASGATTTSRNGRLQKLKIRAPGKNSARRVRAARQRRTADTEQCLYGAAPDCPVPLEDTVSNGRQHLNPNGWVTWLAHRTVSGAPIDSSLPQRFLGG